MKHFSILILLALTLPTSLTTDAQTKVKEITPESLWYKYEFSSSTVKGLRSMKDGIHYTSLKNEKIIKSKYISGEDVATLFDCEKFSEIAHISDYTFSADETKILIETNIKEIYRRSYTADCFIYDIEKKQLKPLSENGRQRLPDFSPDGKKVAFMRDNNMFIKILDDNKEIQITKDGKLNEIINGAPDWVYEEEFEFNKAHQWSPDSKYIAYIKFDERSVPVFNMAEYKGMYPALSNNSLYPANRQFKYPKAGEANSKVSVHVYNLSDKSTKTMETGNEEYLPRIKWTKEAGKLCIYRLNRHQNKLEFLKADAISGKSSVFYTDENKYYIEEKFFDNLTFLNDNKGFIMTSERDGYNHLYHFNMKGKIQKQITKGKWDVTKFLGYEPKKRMLYYQAAAINPMQREIYKIRIDGKKAMKLSTEEAGTNSAVFSKNYKFFINYFSSINIPNTVTLCNNKGKVIRTMVENKKLLEKVNTYGGVNKEFFSFKTSEGVQLNGWMVKPHDFDKSKKYPVFMTQYSGPNSQQVINKWSFGWEQLLAQKGFIVACVDGRGTGARGQEFRKMTYKQLGKYEVKDQIEAAKYLGKLSYTDADRIGIYGWSYGGFMSSLCMTKGADYFKAGIAVAPVTNWRYYDNIYTERFMRTPAENPNGYDNNSPINHADKLKGKFLLIHGTSDDNVHVQNTFEFSEALVQAGKQFEMQIYTNRNHGIYGGKTRLHLFTKMTNFLIQNLMK